MAFVDAWRSQRPILTEGAVFERVRRNLDLKFDPSIAHGGLIYDESGREALRNIHENYVKAGDAQDFQLRCSPTHGEPARQT